MKNKILLLSTVSGLFILTFLFALLAYEETPKWAYFLLAAQFPLLWLRSYEEKKEKKD